MEPIPVDVAVYMALTALALGAIIGAALARRKRQESHWTAAQFDRDLSHLPELQGRSEKYFHRF